ncbi:multidrug resistance protein MdtC [mine drainage metagenome]|uniref:Multidrug resistance protein MdtC n=1 Tax=mine drainage metagenome TaxID=410659 RepID=A0A1J5QJ51_9ZZZZ
MTVSATFIHRPVATSLLTLAITLAGAVAFNLLPVAPLPQVDFPTIAVEAGLPGASPETMATAVATPLERSLGRIAGVSEMTSSSSLGSTRITLQFDLDRDINGAARDVQAGINAAHALLPTGMPTNPTYHKVNPADAPIMILALTSDSLPQGRLYDAASTVLAQKLSQLKGVGQVSVGGSSLPAVRVELNPDALSKYGLALSDVGAAVAATNVNSPKGAIEDGGHRWQISANDQAHTALEYMPLIISYVNGAPVRLSDIAEVTDSVQDLRNEGLSNGKPAVLLQIRRQPNANIIETVDRIRAALPQLRASIPAEIDVGVVIDRSPTIRVSVHDMEVTLAISIGLVVMVVFIFLRNARVTLIPTVAVPVSLIGTFGVMYLCGYSLDNLSLMALTVATGFVVDDAIVVLENVSRYIEQGVPPFQAALRGAREVTFTVLSMSISLIAVFIPLLLMGGIVGRLLREFAVTLSAAVVVSLIVSLTLTPMMCARLLKDRPAATPGRLNVLAERGFNGLLHAYQKTLDVALRHSLLTMLVLMLTICLNVYLYIIVPKGFFPQQDTGRLSGSIQADQGISFQLMQKKLADLVSIVQRDPAVENVVGFIGGGQRNTGFMFASLKPMSQRHMTVDQVIGRLRKSLAHEPGASLYLQPVQDIRMGGRASNAQYQYTIQGDDLMELRTWEPRIRAAMTRLPQLADVNTDQQDRGIETLLTIDRDAAARLGITTRQIDATLNGAFGQRQISTIYAALNQYFVIMEVAPKYWQNPQSLNAIYLTSSNGTQVPLSAISRFESGYGPLVVNHQGQFAASTLSFNLPAGVSLSQATIAIDGAFASLGVPTSIRGGFQGTAKVFQASLQNQPWLIMAALLAVYIVLGILYESYIHPLTIISTLPSAGVGALLALLACGVEFNIMGMIGVILLIGIVKKNAIMMIDFAIDAERSRGISPQEAIYEACLLRFRPIMMTTMAAMLGALPLAFGIGEGSELRQPLGISIVGGLLLSQLLTLYTTPVVYLYLDRFSLWFKRTFRAPPALRMS